MNLDRFLEALAGAKNMKDFKRNLGMENDRSYDVLVTVLCGCAADRRKAVNHPGEFYANFALTHRDCKKAALLSSALSDLEEAFRD